MFFQKIEDTCGVAPPAPPREEILVRLENPGTPPELTSASIAEE